MEIASWSGCTSNIYVPCADSRCQYHRQIPKRTNPFLRDWIQGLLSPAALPKRGPSTSRNFSMRSANGGSGQTNPHRVGDRDGVIIVDHGSRRKESNLMLRCYE